VPRLIVTAAAVTGLERCRRFLETRAPEAAVRAGQVIERHFELVEKQPLIGRPLPRDGAMREIVIPFGDSGYVALYRSDEEDDAVVILAFRHQREAGY
jgi:plasmid stabilization system protein ParE